MYWLSSTLAAGWNRSATDYPFVHPHNDGGNVVLVDGHAKWYGKTDGGMNEPPVQATNRMWNPTLP